MLIAFPADDAVLCSGEESEPVRAYAQVRGSIGGAGHVHPPRLAYPALTWAALLLTGAKTATGDLLEILGPWPLVLASVWAVWAFLFPARPYWYREVMGGGALVSPPEALGALIMRELGEDGAGVAAVHSTGQPLPILRQHGTAVATGSQAKVTRRWPRYAVKQKLTVNHGGRDFEVATINVSESGLAVHWPVEIPFLGELVVVKLADGSGSRRLDAVICWHRNGTERNCAVGLELRPDDHARRAWQKFLELTVDRVVTA
jgi:hypothetical protein